MTCPDTNTPAHRPAVAGRWEPFNAVGRDSLLPICSRSPISGRTLINVLYDYRAVATLLGDDHSSCCPWSWTGLWCSGGWNHIRVRGRWPAS